MGKKGVVELGVSYSCLGLVSPSPSPKTGGGIHVDGRAEFEVGDGNVICAGLGWDLSLERQYQRSRSQVSTG
jgi:hypothetical protein